MKSASSEEPLPGSAAAEIREPTVGGAVVYPTGAALRAACRDGTFTASSAGHAPGYVQANLVMLPQKYAEDFKAFCSGNSASCPLLECTEPGVFEAVKLAPGSDLRSDLPKYRVWRDGVMVEECTDITEFWRDDMQAFLLGCSFTWEDVLAAAGACPRHVEEGRNVPMFDTNIPLKSAGVFEGNMVVSMRPYPPEVTDRVREITSAYPAAHGPPVQIGDPESIGIRDCASPNYGDAVTVREGEIPVFWACGVTPQNALRQARLPFAITHAPGYMFVADVQNEALKDWDVPGQWSARPAE